MKRKRINRPVVLAVLLGILSATLAARYYTPEPVVIDPPKQPHHVIYIYACDVLDGIILTTEPIRYADGYQRMTLDMIALELEALDAGRTLHFTSGLWFSCDADPWPENLDIIERESEVY